MSKRFIDTNLWEKPWFRKLLPVEKSAWLYILTKCDNVGVWTPDFELGDFSIGSSVDWDGFKDRANGNIEVLPNRKWYLVNYVNFQHVDLLNGSKSNACISYLKLLHHHDLLNRFEGLALDSPRSSLGGKARVKDKDKVKDKVKVRVKDKEMEEGIDTIILYFNEKTGGNVKKGTEALRSKIRGRIDNGYSVEECKEAISWCNWKWADDDKMKEYVRISTIFGAEKFPGYVDNFRREVPNE